MTHKLNQCRDCYSYQIGWPLYLLIVSVIRGTINLHHICLLFGLIILVRLKEVEPILNLT
jgi:hypothetical protein